MTMNEEMKKALEELRALCKGNADGLARLATIETAATTATADVKTIRAELDTLKADLVKREQTIKDLQQQARNQTLAADPVKDKRSAMELFGMLCRQSLARHIGDEIPADFRHEAEVLKRYHEQRATLTPDTASGTALVPTALLASVWEGIEGISAVPSLCDLITGLPGPIRIPVLTGRPTLKGARATAATDPTQSDASFTEIDFSPKEAYIFTPVDNRLLQMSAISLGSYMLQLLTDAVNIGLTDWVLNADGTTTYNSLTGLLKDTDSDLLQTLPAGKKAFSDLAYTDMQAGKTSLFRIAQNNGVWLYSSYVSTLVDNIDRLGKVPLVGSKGSGEAPMVNPPLVTVGGNAQRRVMGNDEYVDAYMPGAGDSAAATAFAIFGLMKAIMIGIVGQIQFAASTEYLFGRNQTAFRAVLNMSINRKNGKYLKVFKTAANT